MRSYLPPTSTALAMQIEHGFRGDMSAAGRNDKAIGVDGRRDLRITYERAASVSAAAEGRVG